jgi:Helicase associated domain
LLNYCAESGTCNVPRTKSFTITDGRMMKLGEWVNTQRRQKILGTLAPERVAKLDALVAEGKFVWSLQWVPVKNSPCDGSEQLAAVSEQMITVHQALWNLNYQSLLYFCEAYGHNNVPYHFSQPFIAGHPTPLHLGYWLHRYACVCWWMYLHMCMCVYVCMY